MNNKRGIAILGSTGSIGTQALEVIDANPDLFQVEVLAAHSNSDLLISQALKFQPNAVAIADDSKYDHVFSALNSTGIKVFAGEDSIAQIVEMEAIDVVLAAIVGFAGLRSTIAAIKAGKQVALANKESLVVAGDIVTKLAKEKGVNIFPVDSEHSAIFQCLAGEFDNPIEKIYLTASGGPFLGKDSDFLSKVKPVDALKHPNWEMGDKITIDSASLMNKGLEVIEARWLFNLEPEQIEVIVHPQSIVHSMVQFRDGSIKGQMGLPDMKLPIQYALGYPRRIPSSFPRFNFSDFPNLTFQQADTKNFRNLVLAYDALRRGGNAPCILNAANEVVVSAFLKGAIRFLRMPEIIEQAIHSVRFVKNPTIQDLIETDLEARSYVNKLIK